MDLVMTAKMREQKKCSLSSTGGIRFEMHLLLGIRLSKTGMMGALSFL